MKIKDCRFIVIVFVLISSTTAVHAQGSREQVLEKQLQERDKVIIELLQRVEALERRVGVQRISTDVPGKAKTDGMPATDNEQKQVSRRAPGVVVVDEKDAERALERSLTRAGALLMPAGILEVEPRLSYARREDSTPGLFTSGGQLFASDIERNSNSLIADLSLRLGLPRDAQLEIGLPYRWRQDETVTSVAFTPTNTSSQSGHGLGDVRVGIAKTLLRESLWMPDLIGRITWDSGTGDSNDSGVSLGGGFDELQVSLTAIKRQDPIAFVGGLSYEHSFEKDQFQPGATIAANFGSFIALSPKTSLSFLINAAHQDETEQAGSQIDGSEQTIASFVIGGSTLLAPGTLLNLSLGIGLTDDADDFSLSMSLPIRLDKPLL